MFETVGSPAMWAGFVLFVVLMLAVDLKLLHREAKVVGPREALMWCLVLAGFAGGFGLLENEWFGPERALEFATGYVIDLALAVDKTIVFVINLWVFAILAALQHRVLYLGGNRCTRPPSGLHCCRRCAPTSVSLDDLRFWGDSRSDRFSAPHPESRRDETGGQCGAEIHRPHDARHG
jgi:hypothetical protein